MKRELDANRPKLPGDIARRFAHVRAWVFDLDNTLYPAGSDLWPKIDQRITLFMAQLFGLDGMSSRALQKYYYQRYGTTLRGLMSEHDITAEEFLSFVHDIDRSSLKPDHSLAQGIAAHAHHDRAIGLALGQNITTGGGTIGPLERLGMAAAVQHDRR